MMGQTKHKLIQYLGAILLLVLVLVGMSGCAQKEEEVSGFPVYYLNPSGTKLLTQSRELQGETTEEQVNELLEYLGQVSDRLEYVAPLAQGMTIQSVSVRDGRVLIDFNLGYLEMKPATEVLVRAAIVKTLTGLEDVRMVFFTIDGNGLLDNVGISTGWMTADTFIYNDGNEINTYEETKVRLYFADETGAALVSAFREKYYSTSTPMEKFVVDEVIAGPSGQIEGMHVSVNPETRVISVNTRDRICYVNLDAAFLTPPEGVTLECSIYSIVNSIMAIGSVDKVQILIGGTVPPSFNSTYEMNEDILG